jgi:hypothetical protein
LSVSPPSPYKVTAANHRFFNGTGLANDESIGAVGLNGEVVPVVRTVFPLR